MGLEIHELNTFEGTPGANDYLATDNGNETKKISAEDLLKNVNNAISKLGNDLNGRIDNIIGGGAAPSAAEVTDARLGADGVSYPTLGAAIRAQVNNLNDEIDKLSDGIQSTIYGTALANGTINNPSNAVAVNTNSYTPVEPGKIARCIIKKPFNQNGNYYSYMYTLYAADKSVIKNVTEDDPNNGAVYIPNGAAYIRFSFIERESVSSIATLRTTDFNTGDVVISVESYDTAVNTIREIPLVIEYGVNRYAEDGQIITTQSPIRASVAPFEAWKYPVTITPIGTAITIYSSIDATTWTEIYTGIKNAQTFDFSAYNYLCIQLRRTDGERIPEDSTLMVVAYNHVGEILSDLIKLDDGYDYTGALLSFEIGSRSQGVKIVSNNRIRSEIYKFGQGTSFSVPDGYLLVLNGFDENGAYIYDSNAWVRSITIPHDYYIGVLIRKENNSTIVENEVDAIAEMLTIKPAFSFVQLDDVVAIHEHKYQETTTFKLKKTTSEAYADCDAKLLFITDIHRDIERTKRAISLTNAWGTSFFDAVVNGGDTVELTDTESLTWFYDIIQNLNFDISLLNTVGNHDAWSSLGVIDSDPKVPYNLMIAPIAEREAIVQPANAAANGYSYYYKDFSGTVRIVVLDCMYWNTNQLTWFESVLEDARQRGLHVIAVTHASFPWNDMETVDCLWSKAGFLEGYSDSSAAGDPTRTNIQAAQAVKTFMDNGGIFVCWLTGHQHGDDLHVLPEYGNQYVVTMASFAQRASMLQKSDHPNAYNYDCMTYIAVDTSNKAVKFLRIGADIDMYGVKHEGLSIKYDASKLIASW